MKLFGRFACLYIGGACDRDAWPSRRVRRAAPAAAGGTAATGPARVPFWGAAQPRPGGRNCRPRGETDGSGARAVIQGARRTRGKLREGIRPNPPRRENFHPHSTRREIIFLGKYKMDETFWAFRVSIYRGACDRDAWPSRRVRRAAPAAAGGSRRNGPARCLGGAHARTGGRNCRTCGETNSPLPARKAERKDTSKMERYIFRNCFAFLSKTCYINHTIRAPAGGGAADWRTRSGGSRAGTGRRTDETVHFSLTFSNIFPSPEQAAARKTGGREPFSRSPFAARRSPDGSGPIPAPARTPAAKGGDAYDCPQMKKLLQIVSAHSHRLMAMLTRRSNCSLAEAYQ